MNNLDLDIHNYELKDLLTLFSISNDFSESDLKKCKRTVLMTHPDKSRLPKEYFLFFTKAYKIIYQIFVFKNKTDKDLTTEYSSILSKLKDDSEKKTNIQKFVQTEDFNTQFNKLFDKHHIKNDYENKGYGDFLKSEIKDDNITDLYNGTIPQNERLSRLEHIREKNRALVLHQDIKNMNEYNNYTNISNDAPSHYSSELFSSLPYEDLKKAHTETLIPVTSEDARKEKFSNINDIQQHRASIDTRPLSLQQANRFLAEKATIDNQDTTNRAYRLARQNEMAIQMQNNFSAHFNRLSN